MFDRLEDKTIFFHKQTLFLFILFFFLKYISFVLIPFPLVQALIIMFLVFIIGILFFKNPYYAWGLVLVEILFGGSGHYLEFFGLSIRTIFTMVFFFLWFSYSFSNKKELVKIKINNKFYFFLLSLIILVFFSFILGLKNEHDLKNILADFIPYTIFIFIFPFEYLFENKNFKYFFIRLLIIFVLGSAIFSLFNFLCFRLGIFEIHGDYYKWFRDVLGGKITYLTDYFYRIVLPEHLLVSPLVVFIASLLMRDEKHHKMWRILFLAGTIILLLNFSRAYFMGIFGAFLVLKYKHNLLCWLKVSSWSVLIFILCFSSILFVSSLGKSFGVELLGFRLESLIMPEIEVSTNTRMLKLDPILHLIKTNPVLGSGLGSTINYLNPITYQTVNDKHFDWGFLEMWAELGLITTLSFLFFYFYLILELIKKIRKISNFHDVYIGLLAGIVSLMIINITTPVLFHTLGIFFLSLAIVFIIKPLTLYDEIISIIYRIFNKRSINQ